MTTLAGRNALVTGAGSGIGRAIALALARSGAEVILAGRRAAELETVEREIRDDGGEAYSVILDVTDQNAVRAVIDGIHRRSKTIDILINNAGIALSAPLEKTTDELWAKVMAVNVKAPFFLIRKLAPLMKARGWGRIVNIASTAALEGYAYTSAYTASKHGLLGMTRAFSKEYVAAGVTVNAICPGYTRTDIVESAVQNIVKKTGRSEDAALKDLIGPTPIGRLIEPEEVAAAVLYLCGPGSDATSGQALAVSGGLTEG